MFAVSIFNSEVNFYKDRLVKWSSFLQGLCPLMAVWLTFGMALERGMLPNIIWVVSSKKEQFLQNFKKKRFIIIRFLLYYVDKKSVQSNLWTNTSQGKGKHWPFSTCDLIRWSFVLINHCWFHTHCPFSRDNLYSEAAFSTGLTVIIR